MVDIGKGPTEYRVEDWWDRLAGGSWMFADGNPAAVTYALRSALSANPVPVDDEVLYGKIGPFGQLVHISEVQSAEVPA
jgi:hypothetical protein